MLNDGAARHRRSTRGIKQHTLFNENNEPNALDYMAVMAGYHSSKCTNPSRTTAANSCTLPAAFMHAGQHSEGIFRRGAAETDEEKVAGTGRFTLWDTL